MVFDIFLIVYGVIVLILGLIHILPAQLLDVIALIGSVIGVLPVIRSALQALKSRKANLDLLASVALIFSIFAGEWISAIFINLMLASARLLAKRTQDRARHALALLVKYRPHTANLRTGSDIEQVDINKIKPGDLIVVGIGERIPVDGQIVEGNGEVDQSSFTGESIPVRKQVGDYALTSTLLVSGEVTIKCTKVGTDTSFEKLIKLVSESHSQKAHITGLANDFATVYIVTILIIAGTIIGVLHDVRLALSVLLVVCADDIAVAIPLAFTAAMSHAAHFGVIIKGGEYLEALTKVKQFIFDKTGTLTTGKLTVDAITPIHPSVDPNIVLQLAGSMSEYSEHPISRAIHGFMHEKELKPVEVTNLKEHPGEGLIATIKGKHAALGNIELCERVGIKLTPQLIEHLHKQNSLGFTCIICVYDGHILGFLSIRDEIRPEAVHTLHELRKLGVNKLIMLSGDSKLTAEAIGKKLGLDEVKAELSPRDKLAYLRKLQTQKDLIAMVGDGVNDAPALGLADVGIAMGAIGADVTLETADIVIIKDDLNKIAKSIELGKAVLRVAKENFAMWICLNILGLFLVFIGRISPAEAAAYNFITDFFPIINALRITSIKISDKQ